jgi:hypothetical protein
MPPSDLPTLYTMKNPSLASHNDLIPICPQHPGWLPCSERSIGAVS